MHFWIGATCTSERLIAKKIRYKKYFSQDESRALADVKCEQLAAQLPFQTHSAFWQKRWWSQCVHSCWYLGGKPSRALFRHCGVLSVSAVDGGTSGVSALESQSPSASPGRPTLSSPSASWHKAKTHNGIERTIIQGESWTTSLEVNFLKEKRCLNRLL